MKRCSNSDLLSFDQKCEDYQEQRDNVELERFGFILLEVILHKVYNALFIQ